MWRRWRRWRLRARLTPWNMFLYGRSAVAISHITMAIENMSSAAVAR